MSSSNKKNSAKSAFWTLQAKADEWIDVTPTEEVLRAELSRLQKAFDKCTSQLDSSRLENDLLKDRSIALEDEAKDLKSILDRTNLNLDATSKELDRVKRSSEEQRQSLETTLKSTAEKQAIAEKSVESLKEQMSEAEKQYLSKASMHETEKQSLERRLKVSQGEAKNQKDAAIRFAEDLRTVRENHKQTKKALEKTNKALSSEKELHSKTKKTLGTVATLAETLKVEKQALKRSLAKEESSRIEAEKEKAALTRKLGALTALYDKKQESLRAELGERMNDLEGSNKSIETLQIELKDAEAKLHESSVEAASLKQHMMTMEQGRHELLERQSELQDALDDALGERRMQSESLAKAEELLEKAILERDTLRDQRSAYLQSSEREAELEAKLAEQKAAFEKRLKDIHSILGLKFTTAVKSEVRTIRKAAIAQMPKSLKVPLLQYHHENIHQKHHLQQQRQQVESS